MLSLILRFSCFRVHRDSCSILDLVFLNTLFTDSSITVENEISGHKLVYLTCYLTRPRVTKTKGVCSLKDYAGANNESGLDYLELALNSLNDIPVEILWNKYRSVCEHCIATFIPNYRMPLRRTNHWITKSITHLKRRHYRKRERPQSWITYRMT